MIRANVDSCTPAHEICAAYETSDGEHGFCSAGHLIRMLANSAGGRWRGVYRPMLRAINGRPC